MNYLAHIYLSGNDDLVKIGNFIGDYIKGRRYLEYDDPRIRKGIILHRNIDSFTDHNETARKMKSFLVADYSKYAGIIVDIFYDHFLAINWDKYANISLEDFINHFYHLLKTHEEMLPAPVQKFLPKMIRHNRLLSYKHIEGIENALNVMVKRTSLPDKTQKAKEILNYYYYEMESNFNSFFPQIIDYVNYRFGVLIYPPGSGKRYYLEGRDMNDPGI